MARQDKKGEEKDSEVIESLLNVNHVKIEPADARRKKKKAEKQENSKSGIAGLFRYATALDLTLMLVGIFFSIVQGSTMPILGLVFGSMTNTFMRASIHVNDFWTPPVKDEEYSDKHQGLIYGNDTLSLNETHVFETLSQNSGITMNDFDVSNSELALKQPLTVDEFTSIMFRFSTYYLCIGVAAFVASFLQTFCWELSCERQTFNLRRSFFSQVLRQDTVWCDKNQHGDLSNKLSDDLERIREGIGHKFSVVIQYVAMFISGLCVGMYAEWRLTCTLLAISPFIIGTSAYMARVASTGSAREQLKYSIAAGIAEEVLTCIRTVAAFGGEKKEIQRYDIALEEGRKMAMQRYYVMSVGVFLVFLTLYASYGFAFWFGTRLISLGLTSPGKVFAVFFSVMASAFSIGSILPYINTVSSAIGAASTIFEIIDRVPDIDPYSNEGLKPKSLDGNLEFKNVHFAYPTRPGVQVLKGLNVEIPSGKTVALIGSSGAGKSTIVSLIMRFYDVEHGEVLVDGHNVTQLNLKWLRNNMGIVSQEPILFGVSIAENIRYGREDVTKDEIVEAAKKANAHSFITDLPDDYDTQVGERGTQLSGGQKQRIAIARALVRDPKILLLDEATSALDSQSEGIVQEALENAMKGRTTVVIAHRLSTIRNADLIYAMKDGVAVESGNHDELMAKKGLYYSLVMVQRRDVKDEELAAKVISDRDNKFSSSTSSLARIICDAENDDEKENSLLKLTLRLLVLNREKWGWLTLGILANILMGLVTPIFAFFYGQIFATFELEGEAMKSTALFWSLMFVALGVVSGVSFFAMITCMTTAVEFLVAKLRSDSFRNILRQEISWLDLEDFSVGKLLTKLSRDAPLVKAASGLRVGQVFQSMATLAAALIIALFCGWKLAILLLIAVPILVCVGYHQSSLIRNSLNRDTASMDRAGKVASEAVQNLKTVQSLGKERLFLNLYLSHLAEPFKESKKQAAYFSVTYAVSQAVIFLLYAGAFYYGTRLIVDKDMTPVDVYKVFFALTFCATAVGNSMAFLQDLSRGRMAAKLIFQLMDKTSSVDPLSDEGLKPEIKGQVTFEKVTFSYPTREDVTILKGFSLTAEPGQTVALVGGSGCGKSTVVSLLERFYKPDVGKIYVDGTDIQKMNVSHLRANIGIVTQEPILFACSIRDNIAYGRITFGEEVSDTEVIEAAKKANIHEFIAGLPLGYDTLCGDRGTQLSGGQKQRIAIARALLRDPKILLLDEATSALDTESEKVVQEALDKAREGRTCIVIAHRLTTIQNADKIAVIHKGKVVEQGKHDELIALTGIYYELVKRQQV